MGVFVQINFLDPLPGCQLKYNRFNNLSLSIAVEQTIFLSMALLHFPLNYVNNKTSTFFDRTFLQNQSNK